MIIIKISVNATRCNPKVDAKHYRHDNPSWVKEKKNLLLEELLGKALNNLKHTEIHSGSVEHQQRSYYYQEAILKGYEDC